MTSVDSGVETGNDSNDSSSVQHETQQQHVTAGQVTSSSIIFPDYGISPINNNEMKIDQYFDNRPCQIRMKCPNDLALTVPRLCFKTDGFDFTAAYKRQDRIWEDSTVLQNDKLSNTEIGKIKQEMKTSAACGIYDGNGTDAELLKNRSVYRAKMKSRSWYKNSTNSLKIDLQYWRVYHIGRKMRLAATVNNTMLMSSLLQTGVSPNSPDSDGRTPLHHAACRGYAKMVQLLLENGADPNQRDCIGNTPLHLAAVTSKISVVTLLLTAGTNVLALDKYGYNPLQLAKAKLRMLRRNYSNKDMDKVKQEMHDIVNMLLAYLLKQKNMQEQVETLSNFCSRLSLSSTSDQVQDDVKDLLTNIDSLSITG
ncbi:ankyrin repeat domain-containing protein 54-like isoform X1 [Cataglyphis hispanica]|uniref:ankyrin repeat domain-containing protein 54-like isoform X1 n=1 Tax=Cataglyphis hispanica TaxID=1086592 RepID=UPI00217FC3BA|nr:ankyrin repeat domain-containing protein 54-like isoform X1 [Cataglyphis hispanica]